MKKKKGLGRGLSALFGDEKSENKLKIKNIPSTTKALIGDLTRNPYQPRQIFNEEKLEELANSIKKNGVIQPIAVRSDKSNEGKYQIVAGERRWLAAQKAGLHEIPIVILDLDDNESLEVAIVENNRFGGTCVNVGCVPKKLYYYLSQLNKDIFMCPADYPYLYMENDPTNILIGNKRHWRTIDKTLCTFITSKELINKYWDNFNKTCLDRHEPFEKYLNEIYKKEICISPIKSLSLHLTNINSSYGLSPFIDYKKLWDEN